MSKHIKEKTKRHRVKKIGTIGVALMVIPAVAIALFTWTLFIQGSFTTGTGEVKYDMAYGVVTPSGTCTGILIDDQKMGMSWDTPFPGDTCVLKIRAIENGNTVDMRLQSVELNGSTLIGTLNVSCGQTVEALPGTGFATVYIDIELDPAAPTGTLVTWLGTGLDWVPAADYDPALCA